MWSLSLIIIFVNEKIINNNITDVNNNCFIFFSNKINKMIDIKNKMAGILLPVKMIDIKKIIEKKIIKLR